MTPDDVVTAVWALTAVAWCTVVGPRLGWWLGRLMGLDK